MGCSASKNITVEPQDIEKNGDGPISNGYHRDDEKIRQEPLQASSLIESEEPPPEVLENPVVNNLQKKVSGLSFELAFEDDKEESIIKKHPPKRFQTLEDRPSTPVTLEKLQEKLEEAEIRRQQILAQRIQSGKLRNGIRKQASEASINPDEEHLKIPPEEPKPTNPYDVGYI